MSNLTKKIQVLLTEEYTDKLNTILLLESLNTGTSTKPLSLSTFVRNIIIDYIDSYDIKQKSYVSDIIQKHINELNKNK